MCLGTIAMGVKDETRKWKKAQAYHQGLPDPVRPTSTSARGYNTSAPASFSAPPTAPTTTPPAVENQSQQDTLKINNKPSKSDLYVT